RRRVDAREVDVGDEVCLGLDLASEAVVRLEADDGARLDLEHGLHLRPEGPDDLIPGDDVICGCYRHGQRAGTGIAAAGGSGSGGASTNSCSTLPRIRFGINATKISPAPSQPSATQL